MLLIRIIKIKFILCTAIPLPAALKSQNTHLLLAVSFGPGTDALFSTKKSRTGESSSVPSAMPLTCADKTELPTTVRSSSTVLFLTGKRSASL